MKKILGLGNALVDLLMIVEDSFVESLSFRKGSMNHMDLNMAKDILKRSASIKKKRVTGGSVANAINGLSKLGVDTAYIGKIGEDEFGDFFRNEMKDNGIMPHLFRGEQGTGTAICMISDDSERTFATYLGAAIELIPDDLSIELFKGNSHFFLEGYLVQNHELVSRSLELAGEAGLKIAIDLASFNIVEENIEFLQDSVKKYVDIVFANEDESRAFTGEKSPEKAVSLLSEYCETAIVKTGQKGSLIIDENKKEYVVDPFKVVPVDTTGAGDFYAAGFFYGLSNNLSIE
ncbi:MAG: adenosine kinase, partial [Candidatus Aminicenantes bacterium]|nr:adenosine kinase [Candidatus Aminicenantes bacterium]